MHIKSFNDFMTGMVLIVIGILLLIPIYVIHRDNHNSPWNRLANIWQAKLDRYVLMFSFLLLIIGGILTAIEALG